ncbi:MAG: DUF1385 domain-containing protein [Clostridiales bacterium]|nr:DUF1385 domain-containing protein [Clostridiales bacterium]
MKRVKIGGQAVIEGVMMKNADKYAVAVRKPDKQIEVKVEDYVSVGSRSAFFRIPVIRGVVNFVESLVIGVKTLTYSASFYDDEEEDHAQNKKEKIQTPEQKKKSDDLMMAGSVAFSLIFAIALFMMLPAFIGEIIGKFIDSRVLMSLIEGVIRLAIFLGYVALISLMKDIQRVFMYHGAEHKTINCFEAGVPLTPENVKKYSRYHKRCGTSFLFIVMIISIIVFMFINADTAWMRLIIRLLLIPVIAGISYEFIMFAGRSDSKIAYILSVPGMWVQRLTTREPDLDMIEVAIASVSAVLDWQEYQEAMRNGEIED